MNTKLFTEEQNATTVKDLQVPDRLVLEDKEVEHISRLAGL